MSFIVGGSSWVGRLGCILVGGRNTLFTIWDKSKVHFREIPFCQFLRRNIIIPIIIWPDCYLLYSYTFSKNIIYSCSCIFIFV